MGEPRKTKRYCVVAYRIEGSGSEWAKGKIMVDKSVNDDEYEALGELKRNVNMALPGSWVIWDEMGSFETIEEANDFASKLSARSEGENTNDLEEEYQGLLLAYDFMDATRAVIDGLNATKDAAILRRLDAESFNAFMADVEHGCVELIDATLKTILDRSE